MEIRYWAVAMAVLMLLCLAGCALGNKAVQMPTEQTTHSTDPQTTTAAPPTTETLQESTTLPPEPTTVPPTTESAPQPTKPAEPVIGWVRQEGKQYYILENGKPATGKVLIDGKIRYFSEKGEYIPLVNPWNYIPEDYEPDLVELTESAKDNCYVDRACYDDLMAMIRDCNRECPSVHVVSGYRTYSYQKQLYERKVKIYMDYGYSKAEAEEYAAMVNARPGTSEHQLGLAVDIVDTRHWKLDAAQAEQPAQKWLMENCWRYGFILRYPKDKTESTGIVYEPWHYRYVGKETAAKIRDSGLTLEEYLQTL